MRNKKIQLVVFIFLFFSFLLSQDISIGPELGYGSYTNIHSLLKITYVISDDSFRFIVSIDGDFFGFNLNDIDSFRQGLEKYIYWNLKADSLQVVLEKKICDLDDAEMVCFYTTSWRLASYGKPYLKFESVKVGKHDLLFGFPYMQDLENKYIDCDPDYMSLDYSTVVKILEDISEENIKNLRKMRNEQKDIEKLFE